MSIVNTLEDSLRGEPFSADLVELEDFLKAPETPSPGKLPDSKIRVCRAPRLTSKRNGFQLVPTLALRDPLLGSLGLVHFLERHEVSEAGNQLEQWIDQAAFMRHLLLTDPTAQRHAPCPVELVGVLPRGDEIRSKLGVQLRDLAQRTSYLHAISVNFLFYGEDGLTMSQADVQRAFAWLLPHTRARFIKKAEPASESVAPGSSESGPAASAPTEARRIEPPTVERLSVVTMNNYRLRGIRKLQLHDRLRVHVVQGHNGSGKSSLVEALELGVTGRVARIDAAGESTGYLGVIAHVREQPVEVRFELAAIGTQPSSTKRLVLDQHGLRRDLVGDPDARSFRLNQAFMDSLAGGNDVERAESLLRAFFPDAHNDYSNLETARMAWENALSALPMPAGEERATFEKRLLGFLEGTAAELDLASLVSPFDSTTTDSLEKLSPGMRDTASRLRSLLEGTPDVEASDLNLEAEHFENKLRVVQLDSNISPAALAQAEHLGRLLEGWAIPKDPTTAGDLPGSVQRWLKLVALTDLGERQLLIAEARDKALVLGAREHGSPEEMVLLGAIPSGELGPLRRQVDAWRQLRDDSANEVRQVAAGVTAGAERRAAASHAYAPRFVKHELDTLDHVGRWLWGKSDFGATIGLALAQRRGREFAGLEIGDPGWTEGWLPQLKELSRAAQQLAKLDVATQGPRARLEALRTARKAALAKRAAEQAVARSFESHVQALHEPLNELLAMFTPARWAYAPAALRPTVRADGVRTVQLLTGDTKDGGVPDRADLRFNTAELNTLTVALFLLCATTVDNPLKTLVLDDPFQNMDELTVCTLLRGLARVATLLPEPWQLLILIHGEETLEAARRELACATYRLSWLAPGSVVHKTIKIEADQFYLRQPEHQPLDQVLDCESSAPPSGS